MFSGNLHILFLNIIWPFFSFHGKYTRNKRKKPNESLKVVSFYFPYFIVDDEHNVHYVIWVKALWVSQYDAKRLFFFFTFSFISQKFARGHWKFVMEFLKIFFYGFSKYTYTQWNFKSVEKKKKNEIEGKKWKYFILV